MSIREAKLREMFTTRYIYGCAMIQKPSLGSAYGSSYRVDCPVDTMDSAFHWSADAGDQHLSVLHPVSTACMCCHRGIVVDSAEGSATSASHDDLLEPRDASVFSIFSVLCVAYVCTLLLLILAIRALDRGAVCPAAVAFFAACGAHYSTITLLPSPLYLLYRSSRSGPPKMDVG